MKSAVQRRVLVLTSTFPRHEGDTLPSFVLRLCQAMEREGWDSWVVAPHASGLKVIDRVGGINCWRFWYAPAQLEQLAYGGGMLANVKQAPWRWLLLPPFLLMQLLAAIVLLHKSRATLIHAHWLIPQGLTAALLKRFFWWRDIRVVMTSHGGDLHARMGGVAGLLLRWSVRQADRVAVVSHSMRELAIAAGVAPDRVVVASMGVDTEKFHPPAARNDARQGIVFVGRLAEKKGVKHLINAFSSLRASLPDVRLKIVGDGPLRSAIEGQVDQLGLTAYVDFVGAVSPDRVPSYFQRAAVFVMPSIVAADGDQEGLGLVAAEAMSCGCPVIAHDLPAIRDLVIHEETGLLVMPGDEQALAAAIMRLMKDDVLRRQLVASAASHVSFYSWPEVAHRYGELYR